MRGIKIMKKKKKKKNKIKTSESVTNKTSEQTLKNNSLG